MKKERPSQTESEREILAQKVEKYIEKNYPVNKTKVREIVSGMELSPMYRYYSVVVGREEKDKIRNLACDHGFWEHVPDNQNIPLMLSAIKLFETRARMEGRILPLSEYVEILANAESTTARRGTRMLFQNSSAETIKHLQRATDLVGFYKELIEK
jgi:hypothetical protein